jgi:ABC-2 type transport system ATP-binding protein
LLQFADVSFGYKRSRPVIKDFSYQVKPGVTVVLGPNGAGKSTLLGLAASALAPWSGKISTAGRESTRRGDRRAYRAAVGWLPQQVQVIPGFTVREQVAYVGWLKGLGRAQAWERAGAALDRLKLLDQADSRVSRLSGGQLRRAGVAMALVHDASVILMDEPTAGLDPAQRANFRRLIGEVSDLVDIVISTHQTEDLAEIAQSVMLLAGGTIRWDGPVGGFLAQGPPETAGSARAEAVYAQLLGDYL